MQDFESSNGWICRWKQRNNIRYKKIQGEKAAADNDSATFWIKNILPSLIKDYSAEDIYKDETLSCKRIG